MQDNKNILIATISSALILILWTWFYERPRLEAARINQEIAAKQKPAAIEAATTSDNKEATTVTLNDKTSNPAPAPIKILLDTKDAVAKSAQNRIEISSPRLGGSINLQGAKFDNLYLKDYRETIKKDSPNVNLLAPADSKNRYFADFGWVSSDQEIDLPDSNTVWSSDSKVLTSETPITLSWKNAQNILFSLEISLDKNFMFFVNSKVENLSDKPIILASYGRINRLLDHIPSSNYILHEGPIGMFDGVLHEMQYKDLEEENNVKFESKKSWLGITDKYWLAAIVPDNQPLEAVFTKENNDNGKIYNVGFISKEAAIAPNEKLELKHKLFAGAKEVALLDQYLKKYDIALFDRAVDFGWYYFLTKPFFFILKFLNSFLGNYGLAILAMTILVKLSMLPLANKSYGAMAKIRKLGPAIDQIKKNNKGNKIQLNKDIMELYKKEGINPASGCLPMLIQIPVFFSLYKVLYVTIDMRHQPFYGWIKDLSAPDPTSIFNLFGLLPFEVGIGFLMIGIWPILMGATMILQQKLGPKVSDPAQAQVMKILPFILIFVFAAFPAGLLIYWTWNNILSIAQQYFVNKKIEAIK